MPQLAARAAAGTSAASKYSITTGRGARAMLFGAFRLLCASRFMLLRRAAFLPPVLLLVVVPTAVVLHAWVDVRTTSELVSR